MELLPDRRIPGDWYDGPIPSCVALEGDAYVESAFIFYGCRAQEQAAVSLGHACHIYMGSMFDVGAKGRVSIGRYSVLTGAHIQCDARIEIGDYATISWNVVFMDSYRLPIDPSARRHALVAAPRLPGRGPCADVPSAPIVLHENVWVGFDACILPGVTIGRGSVVGARSVVNCDVPEYTVVAGNPARPVRRLDPTDQQVDVRLR